MSFAVAIDALELGIIFAIMSFGVFVSYKILNLPDMTTDGSFTTGCAVSALFALHGHPIIGLLAAIAAGACAGFITGFMQTKCKVAPLLSGILTMTALYSINLKIMGSQPNISIFGKDTIFTLVKGLGEYHKFIMAGIILIVTAVALFIFLKTQLGMSLRATGDNEAMVRASSINSDFMKLFGLAMANGLVAFGGAIFAQYQNFADVSGGVGMMVVGVAGIIVGEAFFRKDGMVMAFLAVIFGAIGYRFLLTIALQFGIPAGDLNLFSALLVAAAISIPHFKKKGVH